MGLAKTENFTETQNRIAQIAKALAHPARVAILHHLLRVNRCVGHEIVNEIPLAQPTISRHLRELKDAGLIAGSIEGNRVNYCIDASQWHEVRQMFNALFARIVPEQDCC